MQRKLIKVGTSAAIIVPKELLEREGLKIGDEAYFEVSKKSPLPKTAVDPEVLQWTDEFIKKYKPLLKKLASV
ncbi:AbrB family transcriptional regulator [Patescibacteria group bacterium]|nr:AbrB family transcriptional regulator [Patescibacteria group bacterium]